MDKRVLQIYSVWAKDNLEKQIEVSLKTLGIHSESDIKEARTVGDYTIIDGDSNSYPKDLYDKRRHIVNLIKTDGYKAVIEEFAYTWFNRFVALRFMETHDFLPHGFRVLSSRDGNLEPEILKNFAYVKDELKLDINLCNALKTQGKLEELYRYVLFRQCKALSGILPMLFSDENDYLELLLPKALLKGETFITKLLEIDESEFLNDVEVIGWLYQFYVADDRQEFRDAKVVTKDLIPTLTQVFTPDWIVRYMAENSVGRIWLESYPTSALKSQMKYYVEDAKQETEVQRTIDAIKYSNVNPEDIRIVEPCCGSGHILVYVFDLLQKMYEEKGYATREIPTLILNKNLVGLEIDKRAAQLASFSLIMKARSVNARFFNDNYYTIPQVYEIWDSRALFVNEYKTHLQEMRFLSANEIKNIEWLVDTFRYAKTLGSLLKVENKDFSAIKNTIDKIEHDAVSTVFNYEFLNSGLRCLRHLLRQAEAMARRYDVMITNPPYLGISKMEPAPKTYLQNNYPDSKSDMFAMFMEAPFVKDNGFIAMVNPDSWMFLVSYEGLRKKIIHNESIVNMIHLGLGAFDATVQTTSFVIRNAPIAGNGVYFRLVDEKDKESAFLRGGGIITSLEVFKAIPCNPIAYWLSPRLIEIFKSKKLSDVACTRQGLATGNNDLFLRMWFEIQYDDIKLDSTDYIQAMYTGKKWFPCNKGGEFRKWYGNRERVINWENNGKDIKDYNGAVIRNPNYYFFEGGTWSSLSSGGFSMRYSPKGSIFESKGSMCFANDETDLPYIIGFLNSTVVSELLLALSPTLDYHEGPLSRVPVIIDKDKKQTVDELVNDNIKESKQDWDSFETSWDFKKHPLI